MTSFVKLSSDDNVVTATKAVNAGVTAEAIKTKESVPSGHKIAVCDIKRDNRSPNTHSVLAMRRLILRLVSMFTLIMSSFEIPRLIMSFAQIMNQLILLIMMLVIPLWAFGVLTEILVQEIT